MSCTRWDLCFVCQKTTDKGLRSTEDGWKTFSRNIPKLQKFGKLQFSLTRLDNYGSEDSESGINLLYQYLKERSANYHKGCLDNHNDRMVERARKFFEKQASKRTSDQNLLLPSPPCKLRSTTPKETDNFVCCFCNEHDSTTNLIAAGTYHANSKKTDWDHVRSLSKKWTAMAICLGDDNLIRRLSIGDVACNELYYHKQKVKHCYQTFRASYISKISKHKSLINDDIEWHRTSALNQIIHHMQECEIADPGKIFEVKSLEDMYIEILQHHDIGHSSHTTRFAQMLLSKNESLEIREPKDQSGLKGMNVLLICFKSTVASSVSDSLMGIKTLLAWIKR